MKTAEEWALENGAYKVEQNPNLWGYVELHAEGFRELAKQIQLDAMKEGARRAADKIQPLKYRGLYDMRNSILTTAEQWTEKDL